MLTRKAVARSVWPLLLVLTTACSSPGGMGPQRVASPAVGSPAREGAGATASPEAGTKKRSRGEEAAPVEAGAGRDRSRGGPSPGSLAPPDSPGPRPAVASAFRTDPWGDVERDGAPPAYVDIRRATLRGTRRLLRLTLRVDGEIPRSLPEGTDMTMNFRIEGDDDHQLYALGTRDGWKADLDNSGSFPGRFALAGDRFVFQLSWRRLGGPARLRWEAETAWTRTPSGPLGQTEFAFDRVPEYEAASYPE